MEFYSPKTFYNLHCMCNYGHKIVNWSPIKLTMPLICICINRFVGMHAPNNICFGLGLFDKHFGLTARVFFLGTDFIVSAN